VERESNLPGSPWRRGGRDRKRAGAAVACSGHAGLRRWRMVATKGGDEGGAFPHRWRLRKKKLKKGTGERGKKIG